MRRSRVRNTILAGILILPSLAAAQGASGPEQQIAQLDKDRFAAMIKVDEAALNKLLSDDVVYTHSTALVQTKKEFIASLKEGGIKYLSLTPSASDMKVRVMGNVAVVTGLAAVHVIDHGTDKNMKIRYTEAHANRGGAWQLIAWQSTVAP